MNSPSITKIIAGNNVDNGTVMASCSVTGNRDKLITTGRVKINDTLPADIANKYLDRFTGENQYSN